MVLNFGEHEQPQTQNLLLVSESQRFLKKLGILPEEDPLYFCLHHLVTHLSLAATESDNTCAKRKTEVLGLGEMDVLLAAANEVTSIFSLHTHGLTNRREL